MQIKEDNSSIEISKLKSLLFRGSKPKLKLIDFSQYYCFSLENYKILTYVTNFNQQNFDSQSEESLTSNFCGDAGL